MSGRPATSSHREALRSLLWRLQTPLGLVAMFGAALLLRIALAPGTGFYEDMRTFQGWAARLGDVGVGRFYAADEFADYPPGYLYVLWLITKVSATPGYLLLKLPAILADLGIAWIAGTFAARLAPESLRARWPVKALVCAAVLFNPAFIALSAVWGQVDSVPALFVLASLLLLYTRPPSLVYELPAFLLFTVAIAMKPQSGLVIPVMLYALFRRHLYRRPPGEMLDGVLRIVLIGVIALGLWFASALPFGLGPVSLVRFYSDSASLRPFTSLNAFNFWGIFAFWRDDSVSIAGISAFHVGVVLFVAATAAVLWSVHRAIERGAQEAVALMIASASVSLLAFVFLTRMHERYLFLTLVVLAPLVFLRPLRLSYAGLSALMFLNLWYAYAAFNSRANIEGFRFDPWFGWLFGGFATDSWQKKLLSLMVTVIGITVASLGSRWALAATGSTGREPNTAPISVAPDRGPRPAGPEARRAAIASRFGPIALVALTCLFGLVVLRGETVKAVNLNDSAFHLQMVRWADGQISEGRVPLDGWYPYLSLGSSQFHHYQSLPHTLTAYAARATGAGDQTTYLWILYLLLALWPISVYWGARLLGWDRWSAAAAAAVSPLLVSASGYGYEHGSYTWRGYGVYSQLWGMWLLPLAWGLTWRAVTRGRYYAAAVLVLALTMACHFITGYLAVLTVGAWVVVAGRGYVRRAVRAAVVVFGSVLVGAWVLVPLIGDTKWTTQSEYYTGTFFNDSYGARKVLGWLFSGEIFDSGRFPVVSLVFAAGVVLCVTQARRDIRARALLGALVLSLLLFFGRPTLGPLLDVLPGMHDVQIHRFVMGVHLAGILIAGVGLAWLARLTVILASRLPVTNRALAAGAAAVAVAIVVLAPAWTERAHFDRRGSQMIEAQVSSDATDGRDLDRLVAIVKARGDGRAYAGLRSNFGATYKVGEVPVMAWLADRNVDTVGFTFRTIASLSTDVEAAFDDTNPAQYEMLGIRYVILPDGREPGVPATLVARSGAHALWKVNSTGYLQVVDRASPIAADRTNLEHAVRDFMHSDEASHGIYPGVTFPGEVAAPPTFAGATPPPGSVGTVLTQSARPADGVFAGTIEANRPSVVLLKASYDPRWTATVDGLPVQPTMMAPSLVGVEVTAGRHQVEFRYRPIDDYPILLGVGALTLLGLALYPRRTSF